MKRSTMNVAFQQILSVFDETLTKNISMLQKGDNRLWSVLINAGYSENH